MSFKRKKGFRKLLLTMLSPVDNGVGCDPTGDLWCRCQRERQAGKWEDYEKNRSQGASSWQSFGLALPLCLWNSVYFSDACIYIDIYLTHSFSLTSTTSTGCTKTFSRFDFCNSNWDSGRVGMVRKIPPSVVGPDHSYMRWWHPVQVVAHPSKISCGQ